MQTGTPHRIILLHSIELSSEKARQMEQEIHTLFQKTNLQGEWFRSTQFMLDYIKNLKENGLESHSTWLQKRYSEEYEEIVNVLKIKTERDLAYGDFVSLEKLKIDLNELLEEILSRQSKPNNISATVREWIEKREKPFTARDIYNYFGLTKESEKKAVLMTIIRCMRAGYVERMKGIKRGFYRKITQDDNGDIDFGAALKEPEA